MSDIILASVPYTIIDSPPLGIAVLKGVIEHEGFSCQTLDLGMELFKFCDRDRPLFDDLQEYFATPDLKNVPELAELVEKFADHWAQQLLDLKATWIGFSVFSSYSHLATVMLCERIKQQNPQQKIVIGGPAVKIKINQSMWQAYNISSMEKMLDYGEVLKKRQLIDEYVLGDGEQALIDLLTGSIQQDHFYAEDYRLKEYPFANFDDFDLTEYKGQLNRGYTQIPIFSSKGCVRDCDFCDVNVVQNKFRFRTGANIVKEMIYLADRYGIRDFVFVDSLVNGSLKSLREWVTELARYNRENPHKRITWSASGWICRPIGQIPESFYPVMAESGCCTVTIGAESGSNQVLKHMDKKTNVEALYYEIEQFKKHNIQFIPLFIVGHWSEQWSDFLDTAQLIYDLAAYVRSGHMVALNPGLSFNVVKDTPADVNTQENHLIKHSPAIWWTDLNPALTAKERYYRLMLVDRLVNYLNMPMLQPIMAALYNRLTVDSEHSEKFYQEQLKNFAQLPTQQAEYYYQNFDEFFNLLVAKDRSQVELSFELFSSVSNGTEPGIEIQFNGRQLYSGTLSAGTHHIVLPGQIADSNNELRMRFFGKEPGDTVVDDQGRIVADKYIEIKKFTVNQIDLFQDQEFFYQRLQYLVDGQATGVSPGFWMNNSELVLRFQHPFLSWYSLNSNRYKTLDAHIVTEMNLPGSPDKISNEDQFRGKILEILQSYQY